MIFGYGMPFLNAREPSTTKNALDRSSAFQELYEGRAPKCEYVVNGRKYNIGYYLSNGIYPRWATFV